MPAALYNIPDPRDRAAEYRQSALNTYGMQTPNIKAPGKTMGGGIQNAMGGAMTGMAAGSMVSGTTALGLGAGAMAGFGIGGAVLGAASYFLS